MLSGLFLGTIILIQIFGDEEWKTKWSHLMFNTIIGAVMPMMFVFKHPNMKRQLKLFLMFQWNHECSRNKLRGLSIWLLQFTVMSPQILSCFLKFHIIGFCGPIAFEFLRTGLCSNLRYFSIIKPEARKSCNQAVMLFSNRRNLLVLTPLFIYLFEQSSGFECKANNQNMIFLFKTTRHQFRFNCRWRQMSWLHLQRHHIWCWQLSFRPWSPEILVPNSSWQDEQKLSNSYWLLRGWHQLFSFQGQSDCSVNCKR